MFQNNGNNPERRSLGSIVSRTLLVPMLLFVALLAGVIFFAERLIRTQTDLLHSNEVLSDSRLLLRLMVDMETGLRGYLLTGSDKFLEPYRAAEPEILGRIDSLGALVQDSPQQQVEVRKLRDAYIGWHQYAEQMIALRSAGESVSDVELNLTGKKQMDEMRRLRDDIVAGREQFSTERVPRAQRAANGLIVVCVLAAGTIFVFIVFFRRPQIVKLVEAVQRNRTQLALATEASNLGTWYWDIERNKQEWSNRCRELFSVPPEVEPSHELFLERVHPEDRARAKEATEKALRSGGAYQVDLRVIWPDGSLHWINFRGRAQLENGRAIAMHGVAIDVSHRMQVEEALQESRMRLEGIVQGAMDAIISVDEQQRIIVFNKAAENIFGVPADEALGSSLDRFIPSRFVERHREHIRSFDRSGVTSRTMQSRGVLTALRANGEEFPIEATISKVQFHSHRLFTVILRDITERHEADERLRASEEKFRAAFQFAAVGIGRVRFADARWMDANEALCDMVGYTEEEMRATPWPEITHPEDVDLDRIPFQRMSAGEIDHYAVEKRFIHKEGRIVWARLTLSLARDAAGNPEYEIAIVENITERKKADQELSEKARLIDLSSDAILVRDEEHRILAWNRGAAEVYGYTAEEALGRVSHELLHTQFPQPLESIRSSFQSAGRWFGELTQTHKDGSKIVVASRWSLDPFGHKILETNTEITRRKETEEALKRSELRLRGLANALPQLVWTAAANGAIDYVNDRWVKYTGLDVEQTAKTNGMELVFPEDRDFVADAWSVALAEKTELNIEFRLRGVDGEYRWFLVRAVPIFDHGKVVRWFGSCTDIEEMKRSQELLIRSEKLATTGRMAATVAHEINNPLAVVTNTLYLALSDQKLSDQTRTQLELAQRELARVAHLTQQTLGFYRERYEPAVVKMSAVAEDVAEVFEAKFRQKQIELVREFAEDDSIRIVEGELRQIISNLLANALDVAPERSQIFMRSNRLQATNGKAATVQFTLADCGPGIPRAIREKIFEPFFTTKLAYGTGLGLWVTRSLTIKHSGTIRVRSPKGMGAVFCVRFPAAADHNTEPGTKILRDVVNQQRSA
jgi:PAS domain S-box-containing protein